MKAMSFDIFKDNGKDYSNGGISSKFNNVLLVCEDGYLDVNGNEENLVMLKTKKVGNIEYKYFEPVAKPSGVGYMDGGTIVYSSDARFPHLYPLKLHDRTESQEQYNRFAD